MSSVTQNTQRPASSMMATLRHARYIISDNPVTGLAFGLFVIIVFLALFAPFIVPHDPLASNTAVALKPPSAANWFASPSGTAGSTRRSSRASPRIAPAAPSATWARPSGSRRPSSSGSRA